MYIIYIYSKTMLRRFEQVIRVAEVRTFLVDNQNALLRSGYLLRLGCALSQVCRCRMLSSAGESLILLQCLEGYALVRG